MTRAGGDGCLIHRATSIDVVNLYHEVLNIKSRLAFHHHMFVDTLLDICNAVMVSIVVATERPTSICAMACPTPLTRWQHIRVLKPAALHSLPEHTG
ncbi:hypothetical protein I7I48_11086 [Histoplasma ohiense]|nr:hypothetical protein I7I48_11086 [Histoplasma ohiense (nom. inval.)]